MFKFSECEKYVISLSHRNDRRTSFTENLKQHNFKTDEFQFIEAIRDEDFGGLGCSKSHLLALTKFITDSKKQYCAIFEDDFAFRVPFLTLEKVTSNLDSTTNWDVFLLSGIELISFDLGLVIDEHKIEKVFSSVSAPGYIVTRKYVKILIENLLEGIWGMEKYRGIEPRAYIYHQFALDQTWKRLQNRDNWFCTKPMLGQHSSSYSDISKKFIDVSDKSA